MGLDGLDDGPAKLVVRRRPEDLDSVALDRLPSAGSAASVGGVAAGAASTGVPCSSVRMVTVPLPPSIRTFIPGSATFIPVLLVVVLLLTYW